MVGEIHRDELGNAKIDLTEADRKAFDKSRYTYIFHSFDEEKQRYVSCFDLFSQAVGRISTAQADPEYFEVHLYKTPDHPPYDFHIRHYNTLLDMKTTFFKEAFEDRRFIQGFPPSHEYYVIILPQSDYIKIMECINGYRLLPIRDLLFEVIAIAQHHYIQNVAHWESPEMQKIINTAKKETDKVIQAIEKLEYEGWSNEGTDSKLPSELLQIQFVYNDGTIKVDHPWLAGEFVEHFKNYYNDGRYKNWRKELQRWPDRFTDNDKANQFKFKLAKSFYNLLTHIGRHNIIKQSATPNELMKCIAELMEFCLIKVGSPDEILEVKAKHIRNWVKRHEIRPMLTAAEIPANREKLLKYFDPSLIDIAGDVKSLRAIAIANLLCKRFDIEHLFADFAHLAQSLLDVYWLIGHQLLGPDRPFKQNFPEFRDFSELVNGVRGGRRLASIIYRFEGDDQSHELTQRLPMYLLEESLKEYSGDHRAEFDTDTVKTSYARTEEDRIKVTHELEFNSPENRFMVRLVAALYAYLKAEVPPSEFDYMPSEKYYAIIAVIFEETDIFYQNHLQGHFAIQEIKRWHRLASKR